MIEYIRAYRKCFGVEPICAVLNEHGITIAPSTFHLYAARDFGPTQAELTDAYAANDLFDVWVTNRRLYGRRKLWKAICRDGWNMGRDQVERLMNIVGISGIRRGRRRTVTTESDPKAPRHPDHIKRQWSLPQRPDLWWVADFSYVWTTAGFCYVSFVSDVYSRRILGWRVTTSKETPLVESALEQAVATRRRTSYEFTTTGLIHHSDAGSQFTSISFTKALFDAGITGSIGSVGDALDNALMESMIGLFKTEVIEHERPTWLHWRQVEQATASWVHWYNHERLHSAIENIPPVEYEQLHYDATLGHTQPLTA